MADAWKAGEKKGMLSTSNRVISPQDEKRERENNWRGGEGGEGQASHGGGLLAVASRALFLPLPPNHS